jgi:hypothetical protein
MMRFAHPPRISNPFADFRPGSLAGVASHAVLRRDFEDFRRDSQDFGPFGRSHCRVQLFGQRARALGSVAEELSLLANQSQIGLQSRGGGKLLVGFGELAAGGQFSRRIEPPRDFEERLQRQAGDLALVEGVDPRDGARIVARLEVILNVADRDFRDRLLMPQPVSRFAAELFGGFQIAPRGRQISRGCPFQSPASRLIRHLSERLLHRQILPQVRLTNRASRFLQPALFQGDLSFFQFESPGGKHAHADCKSQYVNWFN